MAKEVEKSGGQIADCPPAKRLLLFVSGRWTIGVCEPILESVVVKTHQDGTQDTELREVGRNWLYESAAHVNEPTHWQRLPKDPD